MKAIKYFKRGDTMNLLVTYKVDGTPTSVSAIDIESQIRNQSGRLIADMTVTKLVGTGQFTLEPTDPDTSSWPVGNLICDIQFSENNVIRSTETFGIIVVEEVTK